MLCYSDNIQMAIVLQWQKRFYYYLCDVVL